MNQFFGTFSGNRPMNANYDKKTISISLAFAVIVLNLLVIQAADAAGFIVTGSMSVGRTEQSATLLLNGNVLVAGGTVSVPTSSAELYDPATRTWTATGSMSIPRQDATATFLRTGKVLIEGGYSRNNASGYQSAELYDPGINASPALSVNLTSPLSGATFNQGTNLTLTATASDSDGSVTNVSFFSAATLLGNVTSAPYSLIWSNLSVGTYSLTAQATDNQGATTTSAPVQITVLAGASNSSAYTFTTLAGLAGSSGSTDGTGSSARFSLPFGMTVEAAGNLYVADYANFTIRKVTAAGEVTTLAGLAGSPGSTDGTGSSARFGSPVAGPVDVAVDSAGNVYVADFANDTIRKVTAAGEVSTLAGVAGSSGSTDGIGSAARFNYPNGVAVDTAGNVYVADYGNNTIRKVSATGAVTTLAGRSRSQDSRLTEANGTESRGVM
jgi:Bacterial Ig domain/NHL repeat/Kelch motif